MGGNRGYHSDKQPTFVDMCSRRYTMQKARRNALPHCLSLSLSYSRVFALKIKKRRQTRTQHPMLLPAVSSVSSTTRHKQVLLACRKDNRWLCCVGFLLVVRIVQTEQRERKEASPKKSALLWARSPRTFRHSPLFEGREHCPRLQQSLSFCTIYLHADQKNTNTANVPPIVLMHFFSECYWYEMLLLNYKCVQLL